MEFVKKDKVVQFSAIIASIILSTTALATPMLGTVIGAGLALAIGFLLLMKTCDTVVNNAVAIGKKVGISPMTLGVALGALTSMPELFVSMGAVMTGNSEIGVSNMVGSNIANLLLVLGGTATIKKISAKGMDWKFNAAVMSASTVLFGAQMVMGVMSPVLGVLMLGGLGLYMWKSFKISQKDAENKRKEVAEIANPSAVAMEEEEEEKSEEKKLPLCGNIGFGLAGIAGLIGSAGFVVASAIAFGVALNISPVVIGALAVALGTSLPEMMVNIKSALRGNTDMAIGNILGSNIFNILMIGGLLSLTGASMPVDLNPEENMLGLVNTAAFGISALLVIGIMKVNKGELKRKHGLISLGLYGLYTVATIMLGSD
ncbi:MAG: sodium:calcium antiporter [Alphaproteobacteria bacterium]|nr:sodium:calcium antiporter [Alphaproteobacteria bacterium]